MQNTMQKEAIRDYLDRKPGRQVDAGLREKRFCFVYATRGDLTAKDCAIEAGYSPKNAANVASAMLKRDRVKAEIERVLQSGVTCILRAGVKERSKLYTAYYEVFYRQHFEKQLAELGSYYRDCVLNRRNEAYSRKDRIEGNQNYNVMHKNSVQFAIAQCDAMFGPLNRKKPRFDRFTKKMQYRSVKGCAY